MGIRKEAYNAIESIVGAENVTEDPVMLEAYTRRGLLSDTGWSKKYNYPPTCIVMPSHTREVQEVVRIANGYKIPFIPVSNYALATCSAKTEQSIMIDLKRMDYFEIDAKHMYAVVEPGVIYTRVLKEAFKVGLYTTCPMGGGQVHIIPNTLHYGQSPLNYRTGLANRRILGVEWILPDGEILKLGSLSMSDDPFWGEGIGPDLRGILRGWAGWAGSLGIVTKMAVKLFPFQPERLVPSGVSPDTALLLPEKRVKYYNFQFPTREALLRTLREIGKAEIAAGATRVPHMWRYIAKAKAREDFWKYWGEPGEKEEEVKNVHILRVLLIGYTSEEQLLYEERVLMDIVDEFGGKGRAARSTDESILISADAYGMWFMTGGFTSVTSTIDTMGSALAGGESFAKAKKEFTPPLMDDYGEVGWFQLGELGHMGYLEFPIYWDPSDEEELKRVDELIYLRAAKEDIKDGRYSFFHLLATPLMLVGPPYGPNYHEWMLKIKKVFDPNDLSNPPAPQHGDKFVEEAEWLKPLKDW